MEMALVTCAWVQFLSAMVLFGGSLFRLLLPWAEAIDAALARTLRHAALVAWISAVGWLLLEAANFGTGWSDALNLSVIFSVINDTHFGHLWSVRLTISLILMFVAQGLPARSTYGIVAGLAAIFLGSLALTGHALMDSGYLHPLSQMIHLLAGGAWIGALVPLLLALASSRRSGDVGLASRAVQRFAPLGYVAVAFVLTSGLVNSWYLVDGLSGLFLTPYGRVLLLKLTLVAGMLGCAAANRFHFGPAIALGTINWMQLQRVVLLETGLALAVLAAASVLSTLQPAM